ncbi:MAG TPA: FGGY-family carbohydrate kinase, partial [Candidatus Saccharimonadales bacterium]|nr:FGGY-family carbohydrate kinase [Candidatus Saccharimonadales bacterium]
LAQGDDEEISRAHDVLAGEAAGSPVGASGLLVLPYFNGERTPIADPLARGTIAGVTLAHTRGDLYRAILEGVAFGVRHLIETMRGQEVPVSRLRVAGGGTSSRLAMQIVSDVIGLEQEVPEVTIGAAYGVAYLAALATGPAAERDRPSDAWVRIADRIVPDRERAPAYGERYGLYRQLYRDTRRINHALARSAGATGARATGARPEMELASSNQDHQ